MIKQNNHTEPFMGSVWFLYITKKRAQRTRRHPEMNPLSIPIPPARNPKPPLQRFVLTVGKNKKRKKSTPTNNPKNEITQEGNNPLGKKYPKEWNNPRRIEITLDLRNYDNE